jgi:hypothetical protein
MSPLWGCFSFVGVKLQTFDPYGVGPHFDIGHSALDVRCWILPGTTFDLRPDRPKFTTISNIERPISNYEFVFSVKSYFSDLPFLGSCHNFPLLTKEGTKGWLYQPGLSFGVRTLSLMIKCGRPTCGPMTESANIYSLLPATEMGKLLLDFLGRMPE